MNTLKAGFGRVDITPMLGIALQGYFHPRFADGILDNLEINAIALETDGTKVLLISIDSCEFYKEVMDTCRQRITEITGVPGNAIFISITHSHTSPCLFSPREARNFDAFGEPFDAAQLEILREYELLIYRRIADVARLAIADLKPAKMGWAIGNAPEVAFVRRFRMKDGSVRTNPGVGNPDILYPIGDVDERVNVLRFDQEAGNSLILVNFGNHPDTVCGNKISADWPGYTRRMVEKSIDNTRCIFFNGAQGDVNHINVHETNPLFMQAYSEQEKLTFAEHIGRTVAGAVLQVYDKVNYRDVDSLRFLQKTIAAPSNMPKPEEMEQARLYVALHETGRDSEIPAEGMGVTTLVSEALRMVRLEHGPESFPLLLSGVAIGNVALFGIPGEPFTGIGRGIKEAEGWDLVLPCGLTNDYVAYFPMQEAYDEGGYEARSSSLKAGVAELIINEGKQLLAQLKA